MREKLFVRLSCSPFTRSSTTPMQPRWSRHGTPGWPSADQPQKSPTRSVPSINRYVDRQPHAFLALVYFINQCMTSCFTDPGVLYAIHHSYAPSSSTQLEQDRLGRILCRQPSQYMVQRARREEEDFEYGEK